MEIMKPNRKNALITGATSGIGAAYAHALAERGYDLILTGRRREVIEGVREKIENRFKTKVRVVMAELSDSGDLDQLLHAIHKAGPIDMLVNNAGFTTKGIFHRQDILELEKMVLVHNIAMMKLTHAVLPGMIERQHGVIINVSSIQAVTPMSLSVGYTSVKAFMKNFSISLHCEVKDHGVKIQCVLPGFTRTDLGRGIGVDMNTIEDRRMMRWMLPEEVVRVSLRELDKKNKVICIPGTGNKALYVAAKLLPERWWYLIAPKIVNNMP
ncbi:MAG: SDR family NAD(P)-dependent oxidoreductase [Deltaproteobacteria bacterium]|nr:SDR family NAD(P)-dependent oxidoreductase [Deltaproteobacteria bacterium]